MSKEEVYDGQVDPLMMQIIEICKANKIAMLCSFRLEEDLYCTSALLADEYEPSRGQLKALDILTRNSDNFALAQTTTTKADGSKSVTLRRIS